MGCNLVGDIGAFHPVIQVPTQFEHLPHLALQLTAHPDYFEKSVNLKRVSAISPTAHETCHCRITGQELRLVDPLNRSLDLPKSLQSVCLRPCCYSISAFSVSHSPPHGPTDKLDVARMNTLARLDGYVFHLVSPGSSRSSASSTSPSKKPNGRSSPRRGSPARQPPRKRRGRRPKPTTSNIKVPPPSTPVILRIVLALWAILLSFWQSLVGETRAERVKRSRRAAGSIEEPRSECSELGACGRRRGFCE